MTDNNHPITPPEEVIDKWESEWHHCRGEDTYEVFMAKQAARWGADQQLQLDAEQINQAWQRGADQELEACLDEIYKGVGLRVINYGSHRELLCSDLRAARRPKPPSLKEQALELVDRIEKAESPWAMSELDAIRRALESLPD